MVYKGIEIPTPLPRLTKVEPMDHCSFDGPDLFFKMTLVSISEIFSKKYFKILMHSVQSGGLIKTSVVPMESRKCSKTSLKNEIPIVSLSIFLRAKSLLEMIRMEK